MDANKKKARRVFDYLLRTYRYWDGAWDRYRWTDAAAQEAAWELKQLWEFKEHV